MKFSPSLDGSLRATVVIKHRIDKEFLIDVVAYERAAGTVERPRDLTRAEVEEWVRAWLYFSGAGSNPEWQHFGYREEEAEEIGTWAMEQVKRLYPVLFVMPEARLHG